MLDKGVRITNPSSTQITLRFADGDELTFMAKGREDTHLIIVADVSKKENYNKWRRYTDIVSAEMVVLQQTANVFGIEQ